LFGTIAHTLNCIRDGRRRLVESGAAFSAVAGQHFFAHY
jgi:hypothetical protein